MSEQEEFGALADAIARRMKDAPARPTLRLITTADLPPKPAPIYTDDERAWVHNEIRMWCRVYPIEPYVRRAMKGYVSVEGMPDDELRDLLHFVERCVGSIRDEVPFDEAGIL